MNFKKDLPFLRANKIIILIFFILYIFSSVMIVNYGKCTGLCKLGVIISGFLTLPLIIINKVNTNLSLILYLILLPLYWYLLSLLIIFFYEKLKITFKHYERKNIRRH